MSKASVAAGANGLIIEMHTDPDNSMTGDGVQSLFPDQFANLLNDLEKLGVNWLADDSIRQNRRQITSQVGLNKQNWIYLADPIGSCIHLETGDLQLLFLCRLEHVK